MQTRIKNNTSISYILVGKESPFVSPILPPEAFEENSVLSFIRHCPEDIFQIYSPRDYLALNLIKEFGGYDFQSTTYEGILQMPQYKNKLILYFIDCEAGNHLEIHKALTQSDHSLIYFNFFSKSGYVKTGVLNEVVDPTDFISKIFNNQAQILKQLRSSIEELLPFVSMDNRDYNKYHYFSPTQNNYHLINSLLGNFCIDLSYFRNQNDMMKETDEASNNPDLWTRQNMQVDQILKIDNFTMALYKLEAVKLYTHNEPRYAPLILIFPFHNPSLKVMYDKKKIAPIMMEQTNNYVSFSDSPTVSFAGEIIRRRLHFIDDVAMLHASFKRSPLIRMPVKGKTLYTELSFIGPLSFGNMERPGYRRKLKKLITRIGSELADKYMSLEMQSILTKRDSQIVVISDLPIEWIEINGVPLSFTHDICRLPETTMHSLMRHYVFNNMFNHSISKNILKKTLVIFGCDESNFQHWQNIANNLSDEIGFKTAKCTSLADIKKAIIENKPELLIFDCHGQYDKSKNQTYLLIGEEQLTQDYLVKNNLGAPLVFISACGTAPTYSFVDSISNGFFETGAMSVTTTYLPISIHGGSMIYIRLLQQLSMASNQAIHKNWLNFVSHIIRTSVIHNMHLSARANGGLTKEEYTVENSRTLVESMFFKKRRELFIRLELEIKKLPVDEKKPFSNMIPEYLFYSTLGRADLILFESWKEKHEEINT